MTSKLKNTPSAQSYLAVHQIGQRRFSLALFNWACFPTSRQQLFRSLPDRGMYPFPTLGRSKPKVLNSGEHPVVRRAHPNKVFIADPVQPPPQDVLDRHRRVGGSAAARRPSDLEITDRQDITKPVTGSRVFFPACDTTTVPRLSPVVQECDRAVMMPKRQHTRAADRTRRILEERALSDAHVAERNRPPPFEVPKQHSCPAWGVHDHADA